METDFDIVWAYELYEIAEREWWEAHPDATQEEFERDFELSRI